MIKYAYGVVMNKEKNIRLIKSFIEKLQKERMLKLKAHMDETEQSLGVEYKAIKDTILNIPEKDMEEGEKLTGQEFVDMSYDTMIQDLATSIDCKIYGESAYIKCGRKLYKEFLRGTLDTDRLQTNNVLLSVDLWKKAVLTDKKAIGVGYFQRTIDYLKHRVNYSEVSAKKDNKKVSLPVLTTIQFDNDVNPDNTLNPIEYTKDARFKFESLFSMLSTATDVDAIYNMADLSRDFSIHTYYLPTGIDSASIDDCCLLIRYDHCSLKHSNGAMPRLYRNVYPDVVEEPHFHFNSGFGGVYKLTSKEETHNYGVGYAIGVSRLRDYLQILYTGAFKNKRQEKLFMENDFGMPFLHYKLADMQNGTNHLGEMLDSLTLLMFNEGVAENSTIVESAYKFVRMISNMNQKNLKYKHVIREDVEQQRPKF